MRRLPLLLLVACAHARPAPPPAMSPLEARLDAAVKATLVDAPSPAVTVLVVKDGQPILARGYGDADLENHVPATVDTIYRIGSITKQFTAAAILQLAEQGKLSLDDELGKWVDFPTQGRKVTLRHLLTHTSGIKSYTELPDVIGKYAAVHLSHEELLAKIKDAPFDFEPGARWKYDNSGYYLLGMVIEKASGQPYDKYLAEHVFAPAGLTATSYCENQPLLPHRARGYAPDGHGGMVNAPAIDIDLAFAAGALCSTVGDLVRWQAALAGGKVVSAASYAEMTTSVKPGDGTTPGYGFGLFVEPYAGHAMVSHSGGIHGFVSDERLFPEDRVSVVVLANTMAPTAPLLSARLSLIALGVELADTPVPPEELAAAPGQYRGDKGPPLQIVADKGRLWVLVEGLKLPLFRRADGAYASEMGPDRATTFTIEGGKATSITRISAGKLPEVARRLGD